MGIPWARSARKGIELVKSEWKVLESIAEEMTASAITKAQNLSREYWEAYGPNRASSELPK